MQQHYNLILIDSSKLRRKIRLQVSNEKKKFADLVQTYNNNVKELGCAIIDQDDILKGIIIWPNENAVGMGLIY